MDVKGCDLCKAVFTFHAREGFDILRSRRASMGMQEDYPKSMTSSARDYEICPSCKERFDIWVSSQTK